MARKADVGSAIKQRPPGRRAENISRSACGRSPTTIRSREAMIASTGVQRLGEGENIGFDETTILQAADVGPVFGAGEQSLGKIDARNLNVRVALRQTAGVEAGATGYFQKVGFRAGPGAGPKGVGDCCGVIAEQMLTTECVEP
jgi:hypothetical protein